LLTLFFWALNIIAVVVPTFDSLGLKDDLLRGVYAYSKLINNICPSLPEILIGRRY
jgi:hypothetical protein